jgi:chromate transporter
MSEAAAQPAIGNLAAGRAQPSASVLQIFLEFLTIGGTSFGGGVVAYLRSGLVEKRGWVSDKEFVELLSISQSLPGLNATNMAILVGQRLRGVAGSLAAILGVCLPGGLIMYATGMVYQQHGNRPLVEAVLKAVAAAAVGLILATASQLGKKSLADNYDFIFIVLTVNGVNRLHQSVPRVLIAVGILATLWHHFRRKQKEVAGL